MSWAITATWAFSLEAIQKGCEILKAGGSALDAVEAAAAHAEENQEVDSVGLGGHLNACGELELDAAVMDGATLGVGAVGALRGRVNACHAARLVMEHTLHNLLVGHGAEQFAAQYGMPVVETTTEQARAFYQEEKARREQIAEPGLEGHDTIGVIAMDRQGNIACATSTSGLRFKLPGRVGDSPVIGSGFYADNLAGAAVATGVGEDIMRCCVSFDTVRRMEDGADVAQAVERTIRRACNRMSELGRAYGPFAVVGMDRQGRVAAMSMDQPIGYSYASDTQEPELRQGVVVQGLTQPMSKLRERNFELGLDT